MYVDRSIIQLGCAVVFVTNAVTQQQAHSFPPPHTQRIGYSKSRSLPLSEENPARWTRLNERRVCDGAAKICVGIFNKNARKKCPEGFFSFPTISVFCLC